MEKPPIPNYFATAERQREVDLKWFVKWLMKYHIEPQDKNFAGGIVIPDCDVEWQQLQKLAEEQT